MKFIVLVFLGLLSFAICNDPAEQASGLIKSLVLESEAKLEEFDKSWEKTHGIIKAVLDEVYGEFLETEQECKDKQAAIDETKQDIENSGHYLEWITQKQASNNDKISNLEDAHCSSTQLYINGLKHNKIALSLIQFIRQAIQDKETLSLAQRRSIFGKLNVFFQMYAKDEVQGLEALLQEDGDYNVDIDTESVQKRSDDEIGNKHVDEDGELIEVEQFESSERKDWPSYKAALLEILDTLEKNISDSMETSQDEQINSGISLADYKIKIESENQQLGRHYQGEQDKIERLEAKTVRQQAAHRVCMDELNIVFETLIQTRSDYDQKVQNHDDKRASLQDEFDVMNWVNQQYQQKVNVDDSYADREVDGFTLNLK